MSLPDRALRTVRDRAPRLARPLTPLAAAVFLVAARDGHRVEQEISQQADAAGHVIADHPGMDVDALDPARPGQLPASFLTTARDKIVSCFARSATRRGWPCSFAYRGAAPMLRATVIPEPVVANRPLASPAIG